MSLSQRVVVQNIRLSHVLHVIYASDNPKTGENITITPEEDHRPKRWEGANSITM